jgi:predicted dehydrogenase
MNSEKIYIIGAGAIAQIHAESIHTYISKDIAICAADPSETARKIFEEKIPGAQTYASAEEMFATNSPNDAIAIVATPPFLHRQNTLEALNAGCHVLCEKPLGLNYAEAEEMFETATRLHRTFACCSNRFYEVDFTKRVQSLIDNRELGELYRIRWVHRYNRARPGIECLPTVTWYLNSQFSGGGTLVDWGVYDLSTLLHLIKPEKVTVLHAWGTRPEIGPKIEGVDINIDFHTGATLLLYRKGNSAPITVEFERASACHGNEMSLSEISGTTGAVSWDWTGLESAPLCLFRDENGEISTTEIAASKKRQPLHEVPIVNLWKLLQGEEHHALHGEIALKHFKLLSAIDEISKGTSKPVTIELYT